MKGPEKAAVYEGHSRFADLHAVEVTGERLEAEQIFINVGGRATVPPIPGIESVPYLDNSVIRREACGSRKVDSESSGHRTIELDAVDCTESRFVGKVKGSSR